MADDLLDRGDREIAVGGPHHALEEGAVEEQIAELAPEPAEDGPLPRDVRPAGEDPVQRRVPLQAGDERRGVGAEPGRWRPEGALERAARPRLERPHRDLVEAERLEEPRREPGKARLGHDHLHPGRGHR